MARIGTKKFEESFYYVMETLRDSEKNSDLVPDDIKAARVLEYDRIISTARRGLITAREALQMATR